METVCLIKCETCCPELLSPACSHYTALYTPKMCLINVMNLPRSLINFTIYLKIVV